MTRASLFSDRYNNTIPPFRENLTTLLFGFISGNLFWHVVHISLSLDTNSNCKIYPTPRYLSSRCQPLLKYIRYPHDIIVIHERWVTTFLAHGRHVSFHCWESPAYFYVGVQRNRCELNAPVCTNVF